MSGTFYCRRGLAGRPRYERVWRRTHQSFLRTRMMMRCRVKHQEWHNSVATDARNRQSEVTRGLARNAAGDASTGLLLCVHWLSPATPRLKQPPSTEARCWKWDIVDRSTDRPKDAVRPRRIWTSAAVCVSFGLPPPHMSGQCACRICMCVCVDQEASARQHT